MMTIKRMMRRYKNEMRMRAGLEWNELAGRRNQQHSKGDVF
jgi:hypothetical protein